MFLFWGAAPSPARDFFKKSPLTPKISPEKGRQICPRFCGDKTEFRGCDGWRAIYPQRAFLSGAQIAHTHLIRQPAAATFSHRRRRIYPGFRGDKTEFRGFVRERGEGLIPSQGSFCQAFFKKRKAFSGGRRGESREKAIVWLF